MKRPEIPIGTMFKVSDDIDTEDADLSNNFIAYLSALEENGFTLKDARLSLDYDDGTDTPYFRGVYPNGEKTKIRCVVSLHRLEACNPFQSAPAIIRSVETLQAFLNDGRSILTENEDAALRALIKYIEG